MIFTTTVLSPGQSSLPFPPSISPFDAHPPTSAGDSLVCRARASTPASQNTPTETQRPPAPRKCCTLATAVPDPQRSTHNAPSLSLAAALEAAPPPTEAHPAAHISTHQFISRAYSRTTFGSVRVEQGELAQGLKGRQKPWERRGRSPGGPAPCRQTNSVPRNSEGQRTLDAPT